MVLEAKYENDLIRVGDEVVLGKNGINGNVMYVTKIELNKNDQVSKIYAIDSKCNNLKDLIIMNFKPTGFMNKDILHFAEKMAGINY